MFRRLGTAERLSVVLLLGLTACSSFAPTSPALAKDPWETANRTLRHRVAAIELRDGSTETRVVNVRMDARNTSWITEGAERSVDTKEIVRIRVLPERKPLRRLVQGLAAGAAVGALGVVASSGGSGDGDDSALDATFFGGATVVGGAIGLIYGLARPLPGEIIFEATAAPSLPRPE